MTTPTEDPPRYERITSHEIQDISFHELLDPFRAPKGKENRHRNLDVVVNECSDTTSYFSTRTTEGVDILATFYDCQCSGDLSSFYTFACTMKDDEYCYDLGDNVTTQCSHHNATYDFSVDSSTSTIDGLHRVVYCNDYTKNGPKGTLCYNLANVCTFLLKDEHFYTTTKANAVCGDYSLCSTTLTTLGYSSEDIERMCPFMELNGVECNTNGYDLCDYVDNEVFHRSMPDCSNVEACATDSCQKYPRFDPTLERFAMKFPQCAVTSSSSPSKIPSSPPSVVPALSPTIPVTNGGMVDIQNSNVIFLTFTLFFTLFF